MTSRQAIALTAGAVTTVVVFILAMALLFFGGIFAERERLIYVSIALGPVAMFAVMVGYAVWWLVLFLLSLFLPATKPPENRTPGT
jgi:uncharacterized BrkB/YihY/UPF0761 family membrane protein